MKNVRPLFKCDKCKQELEIEVTRIYKERNKLKAENKLLRAHLNNLYEEITSWRSNHMNILKEKEDTE